MIKGLYETHLFVEDLNRSCKFYEETLGLIPAGVNDERKIAFYWIGKAQQQMLGLWEKPKNEIDIRHFAFRCDEEWILNESVPFFKKHNLNFYNFLKDGIERPMVFAWMPAIAIYFDDPDGHNLEFISILEGQAKPEKGIVTYEEWKSF